MGRCVKSGNFTFMETSIRGVVVVEAKRFPDERGFFSETYKKSDYVAGGIDVDFVQDNESVSTQGVLRGMHYQINYPQSKLVRVVDGEVFDVAVDLRAGSPTFGRWHGEILSAENGRQLFIPRGLAHGFLVLSDRAKFSYKCDDIYHPDDEGGLAWDDPTVGIKWPLLAANHPFDSAEITLSDKDRLNPSLGEIIPLRVDWNDCGSDR